MKIAVTIAGFDPSGGAGVLADIKTFSALNCYGAAVITSLTSQNTLGVKKVFHQPLEIVRAQLEPILEDYEIDAVKIGMLPTTEIIEFLAEVIVTRKLRNIILDPVIRSSSGYDLIDREAVKIMLEKLMPLTDLVTPNLDEIGIFTGTRPKNVDEMKIAAANLSQKLSTSHSSPSVLLKGGHLDSNATDVLYDKDRFYIYTSPKIPSRQTHGTGCTLSSAITALMAQNLSIPDSVERAKKYVTHAIATAPPIGKGIGPLNHFFNYQPL